MYLFNGPSAASSLVRLLRQRVYATEQAVESSIRLSEDAPRWPLDGPMRIGNLTTLPIAAATSSFLIH
jgi:hypothetical protein